MSAAVQPLLEAKCISMDFPGVRALDCAGFDVRAGEVHALCGANGAGKSTLVKILGGGYADYTGELFFGGTSVEIRTPQRARELGIEIVFQEVDASLVLDLSVAENLLLDRQASAQGRRWIRWSSMYKQASDVLARLDACIDVKKTVRELSLHERQKVCIARALAQEAKLLILDEPTAPLSLTETEQLFEIIRDLRKSGLATVYISHRLNEVVDVADRVTVFRDGRTIGTVPARPDQLGSIVFMMLNRNLEREFPKETVAIGSEAVRIDGLFRRGKVSSTSCSVHAGEILGITGLVGAGKSELARLIFGADPRDGGEVYVDGRRVPPNSPNRAIASGISLVPEERRRDSLLLEMSVRDNLTLASLKRFCRLGLVDRKRETAYGEQACRDLDIKCQSLSQEVKYLSGGNQQKVVIGKCLASDANVFIFDEPTKGVDVGAKAEIYRLIGEIVRRGGAVIYFSSEIPEIVGICDRILVMRDGSIVKELSRDEATEEKILLAATGGDGTDSGVECEFEDQLA